MSHENQGGLEVTLPSGISGRIREVKLGDLKVLVEDDSGGKPIDRLAAFFSGIWQETTDAGVYVWPKQNVIGPDGSVNWVHALQGDTSALLLDARVATFGDDVYFNPTCENKRCNNSFSWRFKISDLKRSGLSQMAKKSIEENGIEKHFDFTLPKSGVTIGWRCLTRGDQYRVEMASNGNEVSMGENGMLARIPYIPGADSSGNRRRFVQSMGLWDAEVFKEEYEKHDIHNQDTVEIQCPKCKKRQSVAIPVDRDFLSIRSARPPKDASTESGE